MQPVNPLPIPADLPFDNPIPFRTDQLPLLLPFPQPTPDFSLSDPYVPPLAIPAHFANLPDPRVKRTRHHELTDIIVIALCAVISGADSWYDIEKFGHAKKEWLAGFLKLPNGIPSHDTFNRVFTAVNPVAFQDCFTSWVNALWIKLGGAKFLQVDGKSQRGSADSGKGLGCLHTVSVWASEAGIALGQVACEQKSNEITAIPKLLEVLDLEGAIVTIDAMGCQKEIAKLIIKQGGHYLLALKENQPKLYQDVVACFDKALEEGFAGLRYEVYHTTEKGHGRQEERVYTVIYDPPGLSTQGEWEGLKAIILVSRERVAGQHYSHEPHYYICSSAEVAKVLATGIRGHWGIENRVHWVLDVVFREDDCRTRTGNAAENLAWLRRVALAILKQDPSNGSLKGKRKQAGWDNAFLTHLLHLSSFL